MRTLGSVRAPIWLDLLDETARAAAAHGRTDLIQWLTDKRSQLLDPRLRVLIVGESGQGKSQLVNALINAPVCPVGDGRTTAIPTVVQHAEAPSAALVRARDGSADGDSQPVHRTPVPVDQVGATISTRSPNRSLYAEIGVARGLLESGLVLIDTPGADGRDPIGGSGPVAALARVDVVVMVTDATRELSVTELNMLLTVVRSHPQVIVALTKIDIAPHWRVMAERNRAHLSSAGVPAILFPVSASLRLKAARANDKQINAESGFPDLIARLTRDLATKGTALAPATVGLIAGTVIEQLAAPLRAELSIPDTRRPSEPMSQLQDAQRELDNLRRCTMRWQNTLTDEMADLLSDIEYDLRDRTRRILRTVDEAFDEADPLTGWDTFQPWLAENLIEAATANYAWLVERCEWVTTKVARHFAPYGTDDVIPEWKLVLPEDIPDKVPEMERPSIERYTPSQKLFSGLRGSYGGMLMFGLATSLAGLPLINPVSLGAGALFGGKSIRDEGKSLLKRRQAAAKGAAQRYVDDFFLRLNKDCRDAARWVQRTLRDHFTALTEQLQEDIVHSVHRAKRLADADAVERDLRMRETRQKMARLATLYEQARTLSVVPGDAAPVGAPVGPVG
jgi:ribosome biogenesis GTPase A